MLTKVIEEKRNRMTKTRETCQNVSDGSAVENATENHSRDNQQAQGFIEERERLRQCGSVSPGIPSENVVDEEYASDKENQGPAFQTSKKAGAMSRAQADVSQGASSGRVTEVQNLDHMLRKLKGMARSEPRREWHIVVDITCFLDANSFKCLKLLEGIREVRLIIPRIVIQELDSLKRREKIRNAPSKALKWIESCMVELPFWIHVQNSFENLPVGVTPPASPRHDPSPSPIYRANLEDLTSPTNGDHVLDCALMFNTAIFDGQVALLSNDTALKIKAMAEDLVCESPATFCESLLSPYSDRFLWAGSIARGPNWTEKTFHISSNSSATSQELNKKTLLSAARAMTSKRHHNVEGLRNHCKQVQGLKVVLS